MNTLLTAVSTGALVILLAIMAVFLLEVRKVWREAVRFITPPEENAPSALSILLAQVAHQSGQAIAQEVKTTLLGKESAAKRGEAAVAGDVAMDLISAGQPLLAGMLEGFPTLKKRLLKNPSLVGAALELFTKANKATTGQPPMPSGDGQSAFKV